MLQQPRVPPTGQRQAIEVHIKWREVLDYKRELLRCLSIATGWGVDKLDFDMQRPLYMRPQVSGKDQPCAAGARLETNRSNSKYCGNPSASLSAQSTSGKICCLSMSWTAALGTGDSVGLLWLKVCPSTCWRLQNGLGRRGGCCTLWVLSSVYGL